MVGFRGAWVGWRRVSWRAASVLCLGLGLFSACGGKTEDTTAADLCPGLCEKGKACSGAPPLTISCDDFCLGEDARAEATGCHALYEASETCISQLPNVCTASLDCSHSIIATDNCESAYCTAHPNDDVCAVPPQ